MILYFTNRNLEILGSASTKLSKGYQIIEDEVTEDLDSGAVSLNATVAWSDDTRLELEQLMQVGNYILVERDNEATMLTIITSETDTAKRAVSIYAEDAGLDFINEIAPAYTAPSAYTIDWYINMFKGDSDFEIGINEIPDETRQLSWDSSSTVTQRIRSIASQFGDAEISFSFDVSGFVVKHKYINIWEKRGTDVGTELRLDREINSFRVLTSVEELYTGLAVTGSSVDGVPITLTGMTYDDGDIYVDASGNLLSRDSADRWSRLTEDSSYIMGSYHYDTTSQNVLLDKALEYLKAHKEPAVNYEVDIERGLEDARIGDRVNLVDDKGGIYLSARILQLVTSETEGRKEATFGEYLIRSSSLASRTANLLEQYKQGTDDALEKLKDDIESIETSDIVSIITEYCLSTSRTEFIQYGQWSEELPEYQTGYYYYQRQKITFSDGRIVYTDPVYSQTAQVIAEANEAVQTAQESADEAERIANQALTTAGNKCRVFNTTPTPPYDKGDIWFDGVHGNTYVCNTSRSSGSYSSSDWTLYSTDVSNYFWYDSSGAHVSDTQGTVASGNSQTISSTGTVMMQNGKLVTSWTGGAINFYDGSYATARTADLIASYSRSGITQYINNNATMSLTSSGLAFYDPAYSNMARPLAIFGSAGAELYENNKLSASFKSDGIKLYNQNGYLGQHITSSGTTIYDGTVSANDVAQIGSTIRLGKTSTYNLRINASTFDFYNASTKMGEISSASTGGNNTIKIKSGTTTASFVRLEDAEVAIGTGSKELHISTNSGESYINTDFSFGSDISVSGTADFEKAVYVNGGKIQSTYTVSNPLTQQASANLRITDNGWINKIAGSSKRYKTDISDAEEKIFKPHNLYDLRIRQYRYKDGYFSKEDAKADPNAYNLRVGFIAEEIYDLYPNAVTVESGRVENWSERDMIPPMLYLIQEQHKEIEMLKDRVYAMERKN